MHVLCPQPEADMLTQIEKDCLLTCEQCTAACLTCVSACLKEEEIQAMAHCQQCAEACRRCAAACSSMAKGDL
jgi:hypothetical protein